MTETGQRPTEERPILPDDRSGVLLPGNLERYAANWITPAPEIATVVDQFWHVSWSFPDGESTDQRIIDLPAVTVTIEWELPGAKPGANGNESLEHGRYVTQAMLF